MSEELQSYNLMRLKHLMQRRMDAIAKMKESLATGSYKDHPQAIYWHRLAQSLFQLPDEKLRQLRSYREGFLEGMKDLMHVRDPELTQVGWFKNFWRDLTHYPSLNSLRYWELGGRHNQPELETEHARTIVGQMELGEQEARYFNDALEVRERRVKTAEVLKKGTPDSAEVSAEYAMACADLRELQKDLNWDPDKAGSGADAAMTSLARRSSLNAYSTDIHLHRLQDAMIRDLPPRDLRRNKDAPLWYETPSDDEFALLNELRRLPDGEAAVKLIDYLNTCTNVDNVFSQVNRFHNRYTSHHFKGYGADPRTIVKKLPNGCTIRVDFWENGRIEFACKEPVAVTVLREQSPDLFKD